MHRGKCPAWTPTAAPTGSSYFSCLDLTTQNKPPTVPLQPGRLNFIDDARLFSRSIGLLAQTGYLDSAFEFPRLDALQQS